MTLKSLPRKAGTSFQRFAQLVAAGLMAVIFVAFIVQIVFRYVFNFPVGWTSELSVAAWLWLVLWGAGFVLKEEEEIRFDLLSASAGRRTRILMAMVTGVSIIVLFGMSLPAAYSYVTFMKVETTSYLKVRFDWLYSIYLMFSIAVIARYLWKLGQLLRGGASESPEVTKTSSAL
jgi:TRAP-type C4-dicarboxylate transport system permease small subunit